VIGRLRGVLAEIGEEEALIDVGGVGYVVRCGTRTLSRLPALGDEVLLHVEHTFGAETGPRLFGFLGRDERRCFVALQSVQGVGPKAALSVLDVLSPGELAQAIAREDKAAVGRANGVGPKLALRIVVELKDKPLVDVGSFQPSMSSSAVPVAPVVSISGEAVSALMGLGIAEASARRAVDQALIRLGEDADLSGVIRAALQEIGR
jgi:Holliday junction DNA helicase RuvA